ncbi:MAG: hypothetical protein ACO37W_10010 [Prochlorotrichaceae cyanobacterium]
MSRHLERLLAIAESAWRSLIDRLLRSPERQTAVGMAEVLEVSERTIHKDISFLRDRSRFWMNRLKLTQPLTRRIILNRFFSMRWGEYSP